MTSGGTDDDSDSELSRADKVAVKTEGTVAGRPLPPRLARSGIGAPL